MIAWARLFVEALRLDREPEGAVRARAGRGLETGVGGFILFGGEAEDVGRLTADLRADAGRPLWIAADLERGAGQQFRGATQLPPPRALVLGPEEEAKAAVREAATITGSEARALGLNWALAPVLDLDLEPRNPIVGTRSFGADPGRVARLGRAWVEACQATGVAACAKHFPGHGRTVLDSHREVPHVGASRAELEADLAPFRAVAGAVAAVMPAHVVYAALDGRRTATLSPTILGDLLRGELGFRGVVVSDAMIMEGFHGGAAEADAAVRALAAGCDLLLYPSDLERAAAALADAAEADPAVPARAREALERAERVLAGLDAAAEEGPGAVGEARADGGATGREGAGRARALELAGASLRPGAAPPPVEGWSPERPTDVVAVSDDADAGAPGAEDESEPGQEAPDGFGRAFADELRRLGWKEVRLRDPEPGGAPQRVVLLEATPRAWKGRAELSADALGRVRAAAEPASEGPAGEEPAADRSSAVPLLVFGHPRLLEQLGRFAVCAWSSEELMQRAAARWLDGRVRGVAGSTSPA